MIGPCRRAENTKSYLSLGPTQRPNRLHLKARSLLNQSERGLYRAREPLRCEDHFRGSLRIGITPGQLDAVFQIALSRSLSHPIHGSDWRKRPAVDRDSIMSCMSSSLFVCSHSCTSTQSSCLLGTRGKREVLIISDRNETKNLALW
jgi:hypothetical protein